MSETTTISASEVICNLKAVVADLECQQKQQLFKQLQQQVQQQQLLQHQQQAQQERKKKSSTTPQMFLMIPVEDTKKCEGDKSGSNQGKDRGKCSTNGKSQKSLDKKSHNDNAAIELKGVKSRELRAGILYTSCGCLHRDGLQDCCPRSDCQGQAGCLTKPWAECPPGMLCRSRHPETFGAPLNHSHGAMTS
ncbi:uncharacterized protein LOC105692617 [Athalia rosae]|uniref:uncharacterized protein LOC105692617 n=1 Tax=Athalia rosae TaxID=37344 RepID=UPI0006258BF1|nr:uncharacterized protein LOC105692617 [Athalia rosae]